MPRKLNWKRAGRKGPARFEFLEAILVIACFFEVVRVCPQSSQDEHKVRPYSRSSPVSSISLVR